MRVIAGRAKGHVLRAPRLSALRPTSDKVKGAIFSMLEAEAFKMGYTAQESRENGVPATGSPAFPWRRVLDLYAGSGALGIEALSRGAELAHFVEVDSSAAAALKQNLERTRLSAYGRIYRFRAETAISTLEQPYDLILMDPPYTELELPRVLEQLSRSPLVHGATIVVLEHSRDFTPHQSVGRVVLKKTRYHGTSAVSIFVVEDLQHDEQA